jgi:hypothetical protein
MRSTDAGRPDTAAGCTVDSCACVRTSDDAGRYEGATVSANGSDIVRGVEDACGGCSRLASDPASGCERGAVSITVVWAWGAPGSAGECSARGTCTTGTGGDTAATDGGCGSATMAVDGCRRVASGAGIVAFSVGAGTNVDASASICIEAAVGADDCNEDGATTVALVGFGIRVG